MQSSELTQIENELYGFRNSSEMRLVQRWIHLRYELLKETLVDEESPVVRGKAQEIRHMSKLFNERELLDTQGNMGYSGD